jgi:hypothetical protein
MPLAVQGSELPTGHRRTVYRRSSCPSIPRSVSVCSSIYAIDFSGQFSSPPTDCGDVEIYMSPLFRGLGGIGEEHGEVAELMPSTSTGGFTVNVEAIDCDDSLSDSLSNYQFDITGHDLFPEPTKASEDKLPTEQSSTHTHPRSPMAPDKPLKPKASQLFPSPQDPSPSPEHFPPCVPPKPTRPIVPLKSGNTTRPLKIDRSRKRTGPSVPSQRTPPAEAKNAAPTSKPISRATTHANLREAYRKDRQLAERKVFTRGVTPAIPSYPRPHAETPDRNVTQVNTTQPSPDTFESYRFIPLRSKSLSPHCFQLVSFLLIVRKINSSMLTVWIDCHLNPISLTLRRFLPLLLLLLRGITVSGRVVGLSAVHLKSRRPETTWDMGPPLRPIEQYSVIKGL